MGSWHLIRLGNNVLGSPKTPGNLAHIVRNYPRDALIHIHLGRRRLALPSQRRAGRTVGSDGPGIGRVLLGAPDAVRRAEEGRAKVLLLDRQEELVDARGVPARGLSDSGREGAGRLR